MAASSGKLLAAGMLGLGLAAAVLSISYRRGQTHRALALWGPEQAATVATAPVVKALWFDPPLGQITAATTDEVVARASSNRPNVSRTPGFATVRGLLIDDSSFDWQSGPVAEPIGWTFGLEFSDPRGQEVLVLLDPASGLVSMAKEDKTARLTSGAMGQMKAFLQKEFAGQDGGSPSK